MAIKYINDVNPDSRIEIVALTEEILKVSLTDDNTEFAIGQLRRLELSLKRQGETVGILTKAMKLCSQRCSG